MEINNVADFLEVLRGESHTNIGGYPLILICDDGETLCFDCGSKEFRLIADSINNNNRDGWRVVGSCIHWEGEPKICAHCNNEIESAYGIPD